MTVEDLERTFLEDFTTAENATVFFLKQIAIQLAELNEHLKLVDESVFGAKKRAR